MGKRDTVVILVRGLAKLLSEQVKNTVAVLGFFSNSRKAHLPAIRIIEHLILLTKNKTNCLRYKFFKYFRQKRAIKSRPRSRPRPRI